ncbi:FG-GAP-like repeat-containing protein [bacterium]|nr:FG-GAP-like repeat-containing protein [bacterium]
MRGLPLGPAVIFFLLLGWIASLEAAVPVITSRVPDLAVIEGQTLTVTIHATDADHDSLSYHILHAPANTTIHDSVITYSPNYYQAGTDSIVYAVREHPSLYQVQDTFRVFTLDAGITGSYTDVSAAAGLADPGVSNSAAWSDYNRDGVTDVFVANAGGPGQLYWGDSLGGFHPANALPSGGSEDASTAAWGDFNHDGRPDLFVGSAGLFGGSPNHLYRNEPNGSFSDVTVAAGISGNGVTKAVSWVDFDCDGDPDIHVVNYGSKDQLFSCNRSGRFDEQADSVGIADAGDCVAAAWGDYDNDLHPDLYLVRENGANRLFHNNRDSSFTDVAVTAGVAHTGNGASAAWGDYDNDGDLDLFLANKDSVQVLYSNNGNGTFTRMSSCGVGVRGSARSATWMDFDLDGRLDLLVTFADSASKLFQNHGDSTFTNVAPQLKIDSLGYWTSVTWADPTNHGTPDFYLTRRNGTNRYYEGMVQGNWLKVRLHGVVSNRYGLGARIRLRTGSRVQTRWIDGGTGSQSEPAALFGLGTAGVVDSLTVFWPCGLRRDTTGVAVNHMLTWFETDSLFPVIDSTTVYHDTTFLSGPYPIRAWISDNNTVTPTLLYSIDRGRNYVPVAMTSLGNNNYSGNIPGQPSGTRVRYYIRAIDTWGNRSHSPYAAPDSFFSFSADSTRPVIGAATVIRDTSFTAGPYRVEARASDNDSLRNVWLVRSYSRSGVIALVDSTAMTITRRDSTQYLFQAEIPGQPFGTRVDYYVRAVDLAHNWQVRPANALDSATGFRVSHFTPRDPSGAAIRRHGTGAAVADYDQDGLPDVFLPNIDSLDVLLRGTADSSMIVVAGSGVNAVSRATTGGWWGDFNNDGYPDLYLTVLGANVLFANNRNGTFSDATTRAGVGDAGRSWAAAWVDYDRDGRLDLFVANEDGPARLYHNNGDSTFTDKAAAAGLAGSAGAVGCAWCDWDSDGDRDVYVVYYGAANRLYRNNGDGTFTDVTSVADVGGGPASVSAAWFDYDNDSRPDLYVVEQAEDYLYRNNGNGTFTRKDLPSLGFGPTPDGFCALWGDFDNDSRADLFKTRGETGGPDVNLFMRGRADGTFESYSGQAGFIDYGEHRGAAWLDFNRDGRPDLLVNDRAGRVLLYRNINPDGNRWLRLKLVGTRSPTMAIGAQVSAFFGGQRRLRELGGGDSYSGQSEPVLQFGLGSTPAVDSLVIRWPAGVVQRLYNISAGQTLTVTERDSLFPGIVRLDTIPDQYVRGVQPTALVKVQDRDALTLVNLRWRTGTQTAYTSVAMNRDSLRTLGETVFSYWRASLQEQTVGTTVYWRVVASSPRGAADSSATLSFLTRTDSDAPGVILTSVPDSLAPNTQNQMAFQLRFTDGAGVRRAGFRLSGSVYPSGPPVSLSRDTLLSGVVHAVDWNFRIGPWPLGSRFTWFAFAADVSGLADSSDIKSFRISPRLGKASVQDVPVNTADLMRLVYIILGYVAAPSLVDSLGLDLNRDGWFSDIDLQRALAAWRYDASRGTLLAAAGGSGPEPTVSLASARGGAAVSLRNVRPLPFVLLEIEVTPAVARRLTVRPGARAALGEFAGGAADDNTIILLLKPSAGRDEFLAAGDGELCSLLVDGSGATSEVGLKLRRAVLGSFELDGLASGQSGSSAAVTVALPTAFSLEQNYPNPFNPSTTISFGVPQPESGGPGVLRVRLAVYNLRGALVRTLLDSELEPGFHSVVWDGHDSRGRGLPSGVYFCRLVSPQATFTRKMILLK